MKLWPLMWCAMVGLGCESVKSEDLETSGLYALLEADAPGAGKLNVKATLTLGQGSLTYLELTPTDALTATVGETARAMSRKAAFGTTWYEAGFEGGAAGTPVRVSLVRSADTSAPESVVTLPAPLEFSSPPANSPFPRSAGVTVTWGGSGEADPLHLTARGSCIAPVELDLTGDTGTQMLAPFVASSSNETSTCTVSVTLVRRRVGTVDPAYGKGGVFKATVSRALLISSTP
ncbi:MAG: hypothetical protein Q8N23_13435 [Archangium sp.]|nr:hypothetical protein [Archangium sp.]MDP3569276.1 hypothetical protein [Archangium sp.]